MMLISNTGFVDGYDDDYPEYPDDFKKPEDITDWHATQSIQLCELYNGGFFDNTDHSWDWEKYDDEQDARLRNKIKATYWYREIAITPPGIWKNKFIANMNLWMPTYIPLYAAYDNAKSTIEKGYTEYVDNTYKGRVISSEFPQTMLSGNSDYASAGNDTESENINDRQRIKELLENIKELEDGIFNIDEMIVKKCEVMFSCVMTPYVNGL